jgi:uncharacterized protein
VSQHASQPGWVPATARVARRDATVRASDQDRDAVVDRLCAAYADGRLDDADFQQRLDRALRAQHRGELGATLSGLRGPARPRPADRPASWSERVWAFTAHLVGLFTSFIGPLLIFLGVGKSSPYVRAQAAEALNWQISFILLNLVIATLTVFTIGLAALLWIPVALLWPALVVVAAFAAGLGAPVRPRRVLRLVR